MKRKRPRRLPGWLVWLLRWRYPLAVLLQSAAWRLTDEYERWIVEYRIAGEETWLEHVGSYRSARLRARELGGRVIAIARSELPGEVEHLRGG